MTRAYWVNGGLFLAALLVWAVVFATGKLPTQGELLAREQNLLQVFDERAVASITYEGAERLRLVATHDERRFRLVAPVEASAEEAAVDELLRALRYATALRFLPPGSYQPKVLGLDRPRWIMSLDMGQTEYVLKLGGLTQEPAGASYLEVSGGVRPGAYVVSERLVQELTLQSKTFRVRRLVPFDESQTRSLRLVQGDTSVALEQSQSKHWRFTHPFAGARANRLALDRLFADLARIQTADILGLGVAAGLQAQAGDLLQLSIDAEGPEKTTEVSFGGACPGSGNGVVAVRGGAEPLAVCARAGGLEALVRRPRAFIDGRLTSFRVDEVETLRIHNRDQDLVLVRSAEGFRMREPREGDVDFDVGQARLSALVDAAGDWSEAPPFAGLANDLDIEVTFASASAGDAQERIERVQVSQIQPDGFVYAHRLDDSSWLRLAGSSLRLFLADDSLLRSRQVLRLEKGELTEVELSGSNGQQKIQRRGDGQFYLQGEGPRSVDPELAAQLFDRLSQLEASSWVQANGDGDFGFAKPTLRVGLTTTQGRRELVVGGRAAQGGFFATLDGDGVFVLPVETVERIDGLVLSRAGFGFDVGDVQRLVVTVADDSAPLVVEELGSQPLQVGGRRLSEGALLSLLDSLGALEPLAAVSVSGVRPFHGLTPPLFEVEAELVPDVDDAARQAVIRFAVGAADTFRGTSIHYARRLEPAWRDVVFVIPSMRVREVIERL